MKELFKRLMPFFLLAVWSTAAEAQLQKITGSVTDERGAPVPHASVVAKGSNKGTTTDEKGNFNIPLPPGTYSVFTKKGNLFYATRRDEQNNIAPVKVLPGKMTRVDCSVESNQKVLY